MARPLWKELRVARQQRRMAPLAGPGSVPLPPRPRFGIAVVSFAIAMTALGLNQSEGATLRGHELHLHLWAAGTAGAFLIFGSIAVRRFATQLGRLVHAGGGPTAGAALRLIFTITGSIIVVIVTIGMLGVSATKLLAAAGITGIIIGLAAQQSLGNVFAGIVLMVARPFVVGQRIRIRSGSYGGIFDGEVRGMGLTYVDIETDDGLVKIPNLGMLAAGVGPAPSKEQPSGQGQGLYVNRATQKRPPRTPSTHPPRRTHREATPRRPREIIARMRQRRQEQGQGDEASGGDGPGTSAP